MWVATRLTLKSGLSHSCVKERMLTLYVQTVNHLSETYATDHITPKACTKTVRLTQLTNMSPLQYNDALWMKTMPSTQMYVEYVLERTLVEGLPSLIRHTMLSFSGEKHATQTIFGIWNHFLDKVTRSSFRNGYVRHLSFSLKSNKSITECQKNMGQGSLEAKSPKPGEDEQKLKLYIGRELTIANAH